MTITKEQLLAIMPHAKAKIDTFLPIISKYSDEFGINTPLRMAHYLAQIAHESGELRYTEEIASGQAYEGRKDLGNTQPGDGKKFKGRGLIQLTGRANYREYTKYLQGTGMQVDLEQTPELLSKPLGATKSSMWFWSRHGLNLLADSDDFRKITRKINGGYNGLAMRQAYLDRAKKVLCKQ